MRDKVLLNGVRIPTIGFGTWQASDGEEAYKATLWALEAGYTHIDTAAIYGNEESIGKAIKDSNIDRKNLFITTKLWNDVRGYDETIEAFNQSLDRLGLTYVDLYLIHWPNPSKYRSCWEEKNAESWRAMEDLYEQGKIRAIGVSNFLIHHLEALAKTQRISPMINQIKLFPGLNQVEVVNYCNEHGILLEAYSPFGTGKIFNVVELKEMAAKYQKSIAQICIRYALQKGRIPLPKSVTKERIISNLDVYDFELSFEDVALLDRLPNYVSPLKDIDNIDY